MQAGIAGSCCHGAVFYPQSINWTIKLERFMLPMIDLGWTLFGEAAILPLVCTAWLKRWSVITVVGVYYSIPTLLAARLSYRPRQEVICAL